MNDAYDDVMGGRTGLLTLDPPGRSPGERRIDLAPWGATDRVATPARRVEVTLPPQAQPGRSRLSRTTYLARAHWLDAHVSA